MKNKLLLLIGVLLVFLPVLLFRAPANTVISGDGLTTLAWLLAEDGGSGTWEMYPITISTEVGEMVTFAEITNCGKTLRPSSRLPEQIPTPLDYVQNGNNVKIIFSEVPE